MKSIRYRRCFGGYQLLDRYAHWTGITPLTPGGGNDFVYLTADGLLMVSAGYAWDGATMAPDTKSIMRASLIHDALYQLIRTGVLAPSVRSIADDILRDVLEEDGLWLADNGLERAAARAYAAFAHSMVRAFAGRAIQPRTDEVMTAP